MTFEVLFEFAKHTYPNMTVTLSKKIGEATVCIWVWLDDNICKQYRGDGATQDEAANNAWAKVINMLQPQPKDHPMLFEEEHDRL